MKEFIDKLISRLEEKIDLNERLLHRAKQTEFSNLIDKYKALKDTYVEEIKIINELAEEYKGGWISVNERLPENNDSVLCWAKSTARGGDVCFVGSCHNGFWFLQSSANTHSFPGQYEVVAWQPLPAPYTEGE